MRLVVLMLALLGAATAHAESCAGPLSPEHPGYKVWGGWMLPDAGGHEFGVEYLCGTQDSLLLFQQLVERTADGKPVWKSLHQMRIKVPRGDEILIGSDCTVNGTQDPDIVPFGRYTKDHVIVTMAYRTDRRSGKVRRIAPGGLKCEPGLGGD